jgi:hypothetical protein
MWEALLEVKFRNDILRLAGLPVAGLTIASERPVTGYGTMAPSDLSLSFNFPVVWAWNALALVCGKLLETSENAADGCCGSGNFLNRPPAFSLVMRHRTCRSQW